MKIDFKNQGVKLGVYYLYIDYFLYLLVSY